MENELLAHRILLALKTRPHPRLRRSLLRQRPIRRDRGRRLPVEFHTLHSQLSRLCPRRYRRARQLRIRDMFRSALLIPPRRFGLLTAWLLTRPSVLNTYRVNLTAAPPICNSFLRAK